jgi:hypothetical protein
LCRCVCFAHPCPGTRRHRKFEPPSDGARRAWWSRDPVLFSSGVAPPTADAVLRETLLTWVLACRGARNEPALILTIMPARQDCSYTEHSGRNLGRTLGPASP